MPSVLWALCDRILLPACARYELNIGHLLQRGPGAGEQRRADAQPQPEAEQIAWAEVPAGSVVVYTGGVIHGGGANTTTVPRRDEGRGSRG